MITKQRRALFLSHGGGPLPLLGDAAHAEMVSCLEEIARTIPRPSAIILVSAHWEATQATVTTGENPDLIYDYYGFAPESYEIKYPSPGNPALARALLNHLEEAGFNAQADDARGFDHGMFVPMKLMYPQADIPCIQLSLMKSLDPQAHLALGRALQELADPSILLIGSGFTFHNIDVFRGTETPESREGNLAFEQWLLETCSTQAISEDARTQKLADWESAPYGRYCHPREEHLLPLHVCYGYVGSACTKAYELNIVGKKSSMYYWGDSDE